MISRFHTVLTGCMLVLGLAACAPTMAAAPKAKDPELSRTWSDRSTTFLAAGSPTESDEAANIALRYDPANMTALHNKIVSNIMLQDWEGALQAADRTLALKSDDTIAWSNKAIALTNLKRCDEAVRAVDHALAKDEKNAALWYHKARCGAAQGDRGGALKSLEKALALDPKLKTAALTESDLQSLRNTPEFLKLVQ